MSMTSTKGDNRPVSRVRNSAGTDTHLGNEELGLVLLSLLVEIITIRMVQPFRFRRIDSRLLFSFCPFLPKFEVTCRRAIVVCMEPTGITNDISRSISGVRENLWAVVAIQLSEDVCSLEKLLEATV